MAGFNPMSALPPGATAGDGGFGLPVNHAAHGPPLGLVDAFDQDLAFDESLLYVRIAALCALPARHLRRRFWSRPRARAPAPSSTFP